MDCVAVGWLAWVVLLVGVVAGWLVCVCVVFAIGWQLWVAVWSIELLFWERAVGWPLADSVVFGGAFELVGGVGGISVIGLVSGLLVGGLLERVLVWCGCVVGRLRCRFRIWCVMVAVGWRLRGGSVGVVGGVWLVCGLWMGLCGWFGLHWWALVGWWWW